MTIEQAQAELAELTPKCDAAWTALEAKRKEREFYERMHEREIEPLKVAWCKLAARKQLLNSFLEVAK